MRSDEEDAAKCNLLVAYPYCTTNLLSALRRHQGSVRFLLDSGAFTAFMAGKAVELNDYERFVKSLQDAGVDVWRYFTLDVIGNPAETRRNYDTLLSRGLTPIPIFTRGEDPKAIEDYYAMSDVVAIGGVVGTNDPAGFINGMMRHVGNRRVHWLGFTRREFLKHYRPYMCDSSSYSETARYGWLNLYAGGGHWYETISRHEFRKPIPPRLERILQDYGLSSAMLVRNAAWHGAGASRTASRMSWARWQYDIGRQLNVRLFISVSVEKDFEWFVEHHNYWKERTCRVG